jgi:hypothetical protein
MFSPRIILEKSRCAYGRTHSAFGLYGRFLVRCFLWYSHSWTRTTRKPLSWYLHPHGRVVVFTICDAPSQEVMSKSVKVFSGEYVICVPLTRESEHVAQKTHSTSD